MLTIDRSGGNNSRKIIYGALAFVLGFGGSVGTLSILSDNDQPKGEVAGVQDTKDNQDSKDTAQNENTSRSTSNDGKQQSAPSHTERATSPSQASDYEASSLQPATYDPSSWHHK